MAEGYFEGNSQDDGLKFYCMKCGEILNLAKPAVQTQRDKGTEKENDDNDDDDGGKKRVKNE